MCETADSVKDSSVTLGGTLRDHLDHLFLIVERLHTRVYLYLHLFCVNSRFNKTKVNFHHYRKPLEKNKTKQKNHPQSGVSCETEAVFSNILLHALKSGST